MNAELVVIADQHAAVNTFSGLVHKISARQAVYNSIQEHSAIHCGDELNADMSSSFGGIPRSLERGGCH